MAFIERVYIKTVNQGPESADLDYNLQISVMFVITITGEGDDDVNYVNINKNYDNVTYIFKSAKLFVHILG